MVRSRHISILGEYSRGRLFARIPDLNALDRKRKLKIYEVNIPKKKKDKNLNRRVSLETKFYACVETGAIR